ncbi:MAG TPA: antibiotic biosynthesis monooxygenase [Chitinophagaceae bacterium]|jgi:heme-degrading monooxygenase HmoA|nr:antibiotic biosynthesis monooxygenase [Chitinophagaceae bacterium]
MIVRTWHGRTKTTDAKTYRQFVIDTGITEYTSVEGNLGAQIWQRKEGDITHIWTVSWWKDLESIKAFAGDEIEKAKYYEDDKKYLLEFEPTVVHYEAFDFRKVS